MDALHLRALHHGEAEAEEDVFELAARAREDVQPSDRLGRRAGQRHVDAICDQLLLQLGGAELGPARSDQRVERLARGVGGLADGAALLGRKGGDLAKHLRELGLAPEVAHAQLLELLARGGRRDRLLGLLAQLVDPFDHDAGTVSLSRSPRRVISYKATVAAIAALSDSVAIGMRATRSQALSTSSGRPARSAPISSVSAPAPGASGPRRASAADASRPTSSPGS